MKELYKGQFEAWKMRHVVMHESEIFKYFVLSDFTTITCQKLAFISDCKIVEAMRSLENRNKP